MSLQNISSNKGFIAVSALLLIVAGGIAGYFIGISFSADQTIIEVSVGDFYILREDPIILESADEKNYTYTLVEFEMTYFSVSKEVIIFLQQNGIENESDWEEYSESHDIDQTIKFEIGEYYVGDAENTFGDEDYEEAIPLDNNAYHFYWDDNRVVFITGFYLDVYNPISDEAFNGYVSLMSPDLDLIEQLTNETNNARFMPSMREHKIELLGAHIEADPTPEIDILYITVDGIELALEDSIL